MSTTKSTLDLLIQVQQKRQPPVIHGTAIDGGRPGHQRMVITLTAEQVEALQAKGCIVMPIAKPGRA